MASCDNPVAKQYQLGQMIGVNGTPAIVLANGKMIPGYQPAPQLAKNCAGVELRTCPRAVVSRLCCVKNRPGKPLRLTHLSAARKGERSE